MQDIVFLLILVPIRSGLRGFCLLIFINILSDYRQKNPLKYHALPVLIGLILWGNNMEFIAYILLGILIGGVVVWFLAKARFQGVYAKQLAELEGNIKSAEAVNSELSKHLEQKTSR